MLRIGAVSTSTPTAPSAERVGRVAPTSGRHIVGAALTGSKLRSRSSNGGPKWKMFASESCSKIGCFLEAALPVIGPAVALVWMLSIAAFACWAM